MQPDSIDAEFRAPAVVEQPQASQPLAMLDASTPEEYMERISRVCKILVDVVEKQHLSKKLGKGDKKHVELEAWQFLGSMPWIRCSAVIDWTREVEKGWEARAVVYRDGQIVGAGEGMCLRTEYNWKGKDSFSLRSMAQSRAMSRALQGPLRFIFVLAGYAGASAEEMPPEPTAPPTPPRDPLTEALQYAMKIRRVRKISDTAWQELLMELFPDKVTLGAVSEVDLTVDELRELCKVAKERTDHEA